MRQRLCTLGLFALLIVLLGALGASAAGIEVSGGAIEAYVAYNPVPSPAAVPVGTTFQATSDAFRWGGGPSSSIAIPLPAGLVTASDPGDLYLCLGNSPCESGLAATHITVQDTNGDGNREVVAWFHPNDYYTLVQSQLEELYRQEEEVERARSEREDRARAQSEAAKAAEGSGTLSAYVVAPEPLPVIPEAPSTLTFTFTVSGTVYGWSEVLNLNPPIQMIRP